MALIIAIILGGVALAFVLYPLYRRVPGERREQQEQRPRVAGLAAGATPAAIVSANIAEQEQSARTALQEVEFDYQLGNIEQPDYQELRERYMQRALVALKSRYEREQELDDEIEMQLRKLKEKGAHEDTADTDVAKDAAHVESADQ